MYSLLYTYNVLFYTIYSILINVTIYNILYEVYETTNGWQRLQCMTTDVRTLSLHDLQHGWGMALFVKHMRSLLVATKEWQPITHSGGDDNHHEPPR